jgi:hypothetical protein
MEHIVLLDKLSTNYVFSGKIRAQSKGLAPSTTPERSPFNMTTAAKKTLTLVLSDVEMEVLDALSSDKSLSKTAVLRQALRLYQTVDIRQQRGEKLFFENEKSKEKAELMLL